jgi:hypothetical protein
MRYETLADARGKLQGTLAYHNGHAIYINEIRPRDVEKDGQLITEFVCRIQYLTTPDRRNANIVITDPKLSYMEINMGYINAHGYSTWFCRTPLKQYRQGLRNDQTTVRDESGQWRILDFVQLHILGANKETGLMMENKYPSIEEVLENLKNKTMLKCAFHKDFAVYRDSLRGDYVLEHKGIPIAFSDLSMLFVCNPQYGFLREAMTDLKIKVA